MSDTPNGHGRTPATVKAEWIWRGAALVLLGVCTFFVQGLASDTKDTRERVLQMQSSLPEVTGRLNDRINAHAERLNSVDRRNDRQDQDIGELQRRVYPLSRNP